MSIFEVVVSVHDALGAAVPAHAFGGALALAQYAEPRGTVDVDVNVFTPEPPGGALDALAAAGFHRDPAVPEGPPNAGIRLRRQGEASPVDLFLPLGPAYDEMAERIGWFPFGPDLVSLPFLSAEDLTVFKLSFGRAKDWVDLRNLCAAVPGLDDAYIERQLIELRGPTMYPRLARLRELLAQG